MRQRLPVERGSRAPRAGVPTLRLRMGAATALARGQGRVGGVRLLLSGGASVAAHRLAAIGGAHVRSRTRRCRHAPGLPAAFPGRVRPRGLPDPARSAPACLGALRVGSLGAARRRAQLARRCRARRRSRLRASVAAGNGAGLRSAQAEKPSAPRARRPGLRAGKPACPWTIFCSAWPASRR